MIHCGRSTSRSREQSMKRRSRSENMWKICLFYSQNNKIVWLSNMADTFFLRNLGGAQRNVGFFSWLCFTDADWLNRQIPDTFNQETVFLSADAKKSPASVLSPGRHDLQFSFRIPPYSLPSSFESRYGCIRYWLKARIDRPWRFDEVTKSEFHILNVVDVNCPRMLVGDR